MTQAPDPEKEVEIFASHELITIDSRHGYRRFVYDPKGYKCALPLGITDVELGQNIKRALESSRRIPIEDYEKYFNNDNFAATIKVLNKWLFTEFSVGNTKSLEKLSIYCLLSKENDAFVLKSYQREKGINIGDINPENWTRLPLNSTSEEIGRAVKLALTKCRGRGTEKIHERFKELGWE